MIDATRTTTALLDGLFDRANHAAWAEFEARYRPILFNFAKRLGLSDVDAADAAQETLAHFAKGYAEGRYDRGRGRLRQWLIGIAKREIAKARQSSVRHAASRGESAIVEEPDDATLENAWDVERREFLLREALDELRTTSRADDKTLEAFELTTLRGMGAQEVAQTLGISAHDVYLAKSRCLQKVKEIVQRLTAAYEGE
ncbi:MAG: sigma-70 family RNA polymerase sigma factor [Planctomycetota bacterium]|nr:sigma-70 family RNA polymerase sigma factor [Planctomycetota bacterium]